MACYRVNINLHFLSTGTIKDNGSVLNATCSTVRMTNTVCGTVGDFKSSLKQDVTVSLFPLNCDLL